MENSKGDSLAILGICDESHLFPGLEFEPLVSVKATTEDGPAYLKRVTPLSNRRILGRTYERYARVHKCKLRVNGTVQLSAAVRKFPSIKRLAINHLFAPHEVEEMKATCLNHVSRRVGNMMTKSNDKYTLQVRGILCQVFLANLSKRRQAMVRLPAYKRLQTQLYRCNLRFGSDFLTKVWKNVCNRLMRFWFRSEIIEDESHPEVHNYVKQMEIRLPGNDPWKEYGKPPEISDEESRWIRIFYHLLVVIEPTWLENEDSGSIRDEVLKVAAMSQTRHLPLPSVQSLQEKTLEYVSNMTGVDDSTAIERKNSIILGKLLAKELNETLARKDQRISAHSAHLSLSAGSCFEATRAAGGKWTILEEGSDFRDFLDCPVFNWTEPDGEGNQVDCYGNKVCRSECSDLETWRIAYVWLQHRDPVTDAASEILSDRPLAGELGEVIDEFASLTDLLGTGVDIRFGKLIHQWTIVQKNRFEAGGGNLNAKMIIISEPGGKIRPLTSGEAWAYLYMVPAAHYLTIALSHLPQVAQGIKGTAGLYRFGQSYEAHLARKKLKVEPDSAEWKYPHSINADITDDLNDFVEAEEEAGRDTLSYISTSDLSSATDNANRDISRGMMNGFIDGLREGKGGTPRGMKSYLKQAVALLCSDRSVVYECSRKESATILKAVPSATREYTGASGKKKNAWRVHMTFRKGVLMGDPITKVVLSLSSVAAYFAVTKGWTDFREDGIGMFMLGVEAKTPIGQKFACAGDDHLCVGTKQLLYKIPKFLETMHFKISWSKYFISPKYVSYCQEFGLHPRYRADIKVDFLQIRLCSQFRKGGGGGGGDDSFTDPDPLPGKVRALGKIVLYMEERGDLDLQSVSDLDYWPRTSYNPPGWLRLTEGPGMSGADPPWMSEMKRMSTFSLEDEESTRVVRGLIPTLLRLNMPKFFEWSVAKNMLAYLPLDCSHTSGLEAYGESVGVLGIPSNFDFMSDPKVQEYLDDKVAQVDEDISKSLVTPRGYQRTIWERGFLCTTQLVNVLELIEGDEPIKLYSRSEAFNECLSDVRSESSGLSREGLITEIPMWKVQNRIKQEYVRVDQPETIIKSKEIPYTLMMRTGSRVEEAPVQPHRRAGSLLRQVERAVKSRREQIASHAPLAARPIGWRYSGVYVKRVDLDFMLGAKVYKPGLTLEKNYFSGRAYEVFTVSAHDSVLAPPSEQQVEILEDAEPAEP